jgi:hypothetical protein
MRWEGEAPAEPPVDHQSPAAAPRERRPPHSLFENSTNLAPPTIVRPGAHVALRIRSPDFWIA